jgi:hypothetical protein
MKASTLASLSLAIVNRIFLLVVLTKFYGWLKNLTVCERMGKEE